MRQRRRKRQWWRLRQRQHNYDWQKQQWAQQAPPVQQHPPQPPVQVPHQFAHAYAAGRINRAFNLPGIGPWVQHNQHHNQQQYQCQYQQPRVPRDQQNPRYCWTHGHCIADDHHRWTCTRPVPRHCLEATRNNPMGESFTGLPHGNMQRWGMNQEDICSKLNTFAPLRLNACLLVAAVGLLKLVASSAAESKLGRLLCNAQDRTILRLTLNEMGHPQTEATLISMLTVQWQ